MSAQRSAWSEGLPQGLVRNAEGALVIGGVPAPALAERFGTPLLAVDTDAFDAAVARISSAAHDVGAEVAYAGKALLFVALARRLAGTPLLLDVCSLGELLVAERAGFPSERIVLHGCGKTDEEIASAFAGRVGRIVVDGFDELTRLVTAAAAASRRRLDVMLRVNPGIAVRTHAFVRTAGDDSKFGFGLDEVPLAIAEVAAHPGMRFAGIHVHLGSQVRETAPMLAALETALDILAKAGNAGGSPRHLVLGGGFAVGAGPEEVDLDVVPALRDIAAALEHGCAQRGIERPRLGVEPGRALIARAGTSLYRVCAVKRRGIRRFAIVDGSVADNPRPSLYGAYHHPLLASRASASRPRITTVCGRSCESDELVVADLPGDLLAGDLLALCVSGAYTFSMASNYNHFPRPAVVFAGGGNARVVVRRERDAELMDNDEMGDA